MNAAQPASPLPRRRTLTKSLLRLLLLVVLLLVLAAVWLPLLLPRLLEQQGIDLQWQQPRWSWQGLQLQQLELAYQEHRIRANNLQLGWLWQKYPLQSLSIEQLQVQSVLPQGSHTENTRQNTSDLLAMAPWLPSQVDIQHIHADIAGVAQIDGTVKIKAGHNRPLWQPDQLELDLNVQHLNPDWLAGIPAELQPDSLRIRTLTRPDAATIAEEGAIQVLSLDVHSLGQTQVQLSGVLTLLHKEGWQGRLEQARLHLDMPRLLLGELQLEHVQSQLYFAATADENGASLQLTQPASVSAKQVQPEPGTRLQQVTATLDQLQLATRQPGKLPVELSASYHVSIKQLFHPLLHPQAWTASGELNGTLSSLHATVAVTNAGSLQLASNWSLQGETLNGKVTLQDVYFRAGNPLQQTLPGWPEQVEFNNGRLAAGADISLPPSGPMRISGHARGSGLGGLVNSSELDGMDFTLYFRLDKAEQLRLDLPRLVIAELNPGVPIQQLNLLEASYDGHLDRLLEGTAHWHNLRGQLLGGSFSLPASHIRPAAENRLQLQLSGIELHDILTQYPAEGLYGSGTLDGILPLYVSPDGVFIEQGSLQARQPGTLQFQSDKVRALGQANPAMRQVTSALEDFHFEVLSSTLSYEPSGKLLFNIRLEGKNPAVEQGRPIHLNLNLEEDLPALLASIQLSNHVSETLQERIRQRLQNR